MRQLKITKQADREKVSLAYYLKIKQEKSDIFERLGNNEVKDNAELQAKLKSVISEICESQYHFTPTEKQLTGLLNFSLDFVEKYGKRLFQKFFIWCLMQKLTIYLEKISVEELLEEIHAISKKRRAEIKESGFDFNLISILNMENNERYTHSAIIAELLNPEGSHGFGKIFLDKFIESVDENNFDTNSCFVKVEEYVGVITHNNRSSRTFIDIVLRNNCDQEILIENKIWALDQPDQLERTYAGGKCEKRSVIYLTPFGHEYYNDGFKNYKSISYKEHISDWLKECYEIAQLNPLVSNSIKIYKNIVDKITNQSIYKEMNDEIKTTMLSSEKNFNAAADIARNFEELQSLVWDTFWESMKNKLTNHKFSDEVAINKYKYLYEINELASKGDTIYIQIKFTDENDNVLLDDNNVNAVLETLRKEFKGQDDHRSDNWNIWFYADEHNVLYKTYINNISQNQVYQLLTSDEKDFDGQISEISGRFNKILVRLNDLLSQF